MAESRIVLRWIYGHKYLEFGNSFPVNGYYIEKPGNLKEWNLIWCRRIYGHRYLKAENSSLVNGYYIEKPGNLKEWNLC